MKRILRLFLILVLLVVLAAGGLIAWLSVTEYKPEPIEDLALLSSSETMLPPDSSLQLISWNIGYGGLGKNADFFMDGGQNVRSSGPNAVGEYLNGIKAFLRQYPDALMLLQEVDLDSTRSYGIDQVAYLSGEGLPMARVHALNYSTPFVPYPLPPIGKVSSGLYTLSPYKIDLAQRHALPCPFSWPVSTANLKRCLLVSYLPIEGSDRQLVLVNLHLEAYDDGEGKIAQTKQLRDFILSEYEKGNYVIAGGDFNQAFPGSLDVFTNTHPEVWSPGILEQDLLPQGWQLAFDLNTPSCRLLNQPYNPEDTVNTQLYVIDGFLLSPNVELEQVETVDLGFADADHNPVRLQVRLAG